MSETTKVNTDSCDGYVGATYMILGWAMGVVTDVLAAPHAPLRVTRALRVSARRPSAARNACFGDRSRPRGKRFLGHFGPRGRCHPLWNRNDSTKCKRSSDSACPPPVASGLN